MTRTIIALVCLLLSGCTMVSKEMISGIEYREHPHIMLVEYDNFFKLNADCLVQHKFPGLYFGCGYVPYDPAKDCIVRYMKGDEKTKAHETMHCHGYADTWLPWQALRY